jgi:hypothetical protein
MESEWKIYLGDFSVQLFFTMQLECASRRWPSISVARHRDDFVSYLETVIGNDALGPDDGVVVVRFPIYDCEYIREKSRRPAVR